MRLTLRTMLAYLDDILDAKDAEEIAKKVEQSETATGLLHRVRDVMRRLRLPAPNVTDRGAGLDPNTVAEYLDNTLPDARVPDFEKVCLESDVHLAEVASCHQVLALVLGEPAEVDPASRQRMYQLPEVLATKTKPKPSPPKLPERAATDGDHRELIHPPRAKPPVPEYLREAARKRRLWRMVAAVSFLILVVLVVLTATGQLEPGSELGRFLGRLLVGGETAPMAQVSEPVQPGTPAAPPVPKAVEPMDKNRTPEAGQGDQGPEVPVVKQPVDRPPFSPPAATGPEKKLEPGDREKPVVRPLEPGTVGPPGDTRPAGAVGQASVPVPARPDEMVNPIRPPSGELVPKGGPMEPAGMRPEGPTAPEPKKDVATPPSAEPGAKMAQPEPPETAPVPVEQVAKFVTPGQILLRLETNSATWERVAPNALLSSQDRLLSLPAYRPTILLVGGVRAEMVDGTRIDLQPVDNQSAPVVSIDYGQVILKGEGKERTRVGVRMGERSAVVQFGDADSAVAIQVRRGRSPRVDPEVQPLARVADVYVITGKIAWREGADGEFVQLNAPVRITWSEKPREEIAVQQFPRWVSAETAATPLEQQAAVTVERELQDRPVGLAMRELADHRKREVRWLAMRCLGHLGDFKPIVSALNDPEQKQVWPEYVEQLREAVVRTPETAAAIRATMQKLYGNEGISLYEMLWKYPEDRLGPEDAAQLVRYLDHETLAFRVLAFWGNLKRVTGLGLFYRPEDPAAKRQPSIAKWKERLKSSAPAGGAAAREKPGAAELPPRAKTPPSQDGG